MLKENNAYAKECFFKRAIKVFNSKMDTPSTHLIGLALSKNYPYPEEFNQMKAVTAYVVACWHEVKEVCDDRCADFLKRTFVASKPEELRAIIEEFMEYSGFPEEGWLDESN